MTNEVMIEDIKCIKSCLTDRDLYKSNKNLKNFGRSLKRYYIIAQIYNNSDNFIKLKKVIEDELKEHNIELSDICNNIFINVYEEESKQFIQKYKKNNINDMEYINKKLDQFVKNNNDFNVKLTPKFEEPTVFDHNCRGLSDSLLRRIYKFDALVYPHIFKIEDEYFMSIKFKYLIVNEFF